MLLAATGRRVQLVARGWDALRVARCQGDRLDATAAMHDDGDEEDLEDFEVEPAIAHHELGCDAQLSDYELVRRRRPVRI